jgi:uncharacterized protein YjbJ (UPF0337 family)
MDWNRGEGNWKQMKGKVKEQWGKLTDDDLDVIDGRQDQLEGRLQQRSFGTVSRPQGIEQIMGVANNFVWIATTVAAPAGS